MKMTRLEKALVSWAEKHFYVLLILFLTAAAILFRFCLRAILSYDAKGFLLPWYNKIQEAGGLAALKKQVGNYNIAYQILIAILTYLPITPLYAYKILSCIFDFALAIGSAALIYQITTEYRREKAVITYAAILFCPIVWLNSAAWAQCDAIYCFFIVAAFLCLCKERYALSFILLGLSFAFKLQAIFVVPFFGLFWFLKKKFSLVYFFLIPITMEVIALPAILMGRKNGWLSTFTVYLKQSTQYHKLYMSYPSFWAMFWNGTLKDGYTLLKNAAILLTMTALVCLAAIWIVKKVELTCENMLYMLFLLTYTCVFFLPAMHDRYGYVYEILAVLIAVVNKRTRLILPVLVGNMLMVYGHYLFAVPRTVRHLAFVNFAVYLLYLAVLMPQICGFSRKPSLKLAGEQE